MNDQTFVLNCWSSTAWSWFIPNCTSGGPPLPASLDSPLPILNGLQALDFTPDTHPVIKQPKSNGQIFLGQKEIQRSEQLPSLHESQRHIPVREPLRRVPLQGLPGLPIPFFSCTTFSFGDLFFTLGTICRCFRPSCDFLLWSARFC